MNAVRQPYGVLVSVTLLVVVCLASAIPEAVQQSSAGVGAIADSIASVTTTEARMKAIRPALPPQGIIGYVSDLDVTRGDGRRAWYAAEYCLSPLVLSPSPGPAIVLGNFADAANAPAIAQRDGLTIVRDFGGGLILLARVGK